MGWTQRKMVWEVKKGEERCLDGLVMCDTDTE